MFNKTNSSSIAMLKGVGALKQAVREGSARFTEYKETHIIQNGLLEIDTLGDLIVGMKISKEAEEMMKNSEELEMFSDILLSSINMIKQKLTERRLETIKQRALQLKVPKQLIDTINKDEIMSII